MGNKNAQPVLSIGSLKGARSKMEDYHVHLKSLPGQHGFSYYAVFDGHGGTDTAKYCSSNLSKVISKKLCKNMSSEQTQEAITEAFIECDRNFSITKAKLDISGSTAVVCILNKKENKLITANIGDAQAFLSRRGKVIKLTQLHNPQIASEKKRIEGAGFKVVNCRMDGLLGVARAFGDVLFKINKNTDSNDSKKSSTTTDVSTTTIATTTNTTITATTVTDTDNNDNNDNNDSKKQFTTINTTTTTTTTTITTTTTTTGLIGVDMSTNEKYKEVGQLACCCVPYISEITLTPDDEFIVMSCDGLYESMNPTSVIDYIRRRFPRKDLQKRIDIKNFDPAEGKISDIAKNLAEYAIKKGSKDNITIIIVFFPGVTVD